MSFSFRFNPFNSSDRHWRLIRLLTVLGIGSYLSFCLWLTLRQRQLIYRPGSTIQALPNETDFGLPYEELWIPMANSPDRINAWWIPASAEDTPFVALPDEPSQVLSSPKVMLYLYGNGRNKGGRNYLHRMTAFRQLGFSVLAFDYRGFGNSEGDWPSEQQLYADADAAWRYLIEEQGILPEQIVIYGESLGGAIATELATRHPDASGLIVQSSFTTMREAVREQAPITRWFPMQWMLTERFDSLAKVSELAMPVLFIHGSKDDVLPLSMSERLYASAAEPKQLFVIDNAGHHAIYKPDERSYFRAIQQFVQVLEQSASAKNK